MAVETQEIIVYGAIVPDAGMGGSGGISQGGGGGMGIVGPPCPICHNIYYRYDYVNRLVCCSCYNNVDIIRV